MGDESKTPFSQNAKSSRFFCLSSIFLIILPKFLANGRFSKTVDLLRKLLAEGGWAVTQPKRILIL
jgi:hypothetical protein